VIQLRTYQQSAIDAVHWYFQNADGNPVVELPTGSGKSLIQAELIRGLLQKAPTQRFLCLTHVKELIAQNYAELMGIWPMAPAGIYAASLNQRDTREPIIFASIQSVHHRADELGRFDWIIIDECHLVPNSGSGIYRKFISEMQNINPALRVIGLSATPYRLSGGLLVEGKDRLFTDLIPARKTGASVRNLIDAGHLAPLVTPVDRLPRLDTSLVSEHHGEFNQTELVTAVADQSQVTELACKEIVRRGQRRKKWLIFASSMAHCEQIQSLLPVPAMIVHGQLSRLERDAYIRQFRQGQLRALISINVLSTGFNVPDIDLLAMLRPTASASLYVQQAGRGMRTAAAKENCLVLDFAGNIERHGPVDNILPPLRRRKGGEVPMKECEDCIMLVPLIARSCRFCGFEFPIEDSSKLAEQASQSPILDLEQSHIRYEDIRSVFSVQQCPGQPDSIQIDYFDRDQKVASDWLNPLQTDYAGLAAEKWFVEYCEYFGRFQSIVDALDVAEQQAAAPEYIVVDESGRVPRVVDTGPPRRESFPAWMEG
jgi:DNA repair protein RadD